MSVTQRLSEITISGQALNKPFPLLVGATIIISCLLLSVAASPAASRNRQPTDQRRTVSLYQRNGCLTSEQTDYGKEIIKGLNYTSQRAFRKFCTIPGLVFTQYQRIWSVLLNNRLTYAQLRSFEQWFDLFETDLDLCLEAIEEIHTLSFEGCRSFNLLLRLSDATPRFCLKVIPVFNSLSNAKLRTVEGMLSIRDMSAGRMLTTMSLIHTLRGHQHAAAKSFARTLSMDSDRFITALGLLAMLDQEDAWNAHSLYQVEGMTAQEAWDWLIGFFALPDDIQETGYFSLERKQRSLLLDAMHNGGETLIWKLNNLHAVTDRFGVEISASRLRNLPSTELRQRMFALSPVAYEQFADRFARAFEQKDQNRMTALLRKATALERRHIASSLTSANIYALLAMGSELYDSSFRDILLPVLHRRIKAGFQGDLLNFLTSVDEQGTYVADFITACARKGKLPLLFPKQAISRKKVLDLTARSAFRDNDSLLLFSATMLPLFRILDPEARSYLIELMVKETERQPRETGILIAFTLAYYKDFHWKLLSSADLERIELVEKQLQPPPFKHFRHTPFSEWREDAGLGSFSIFHPDDDGRASFLSFARLLLKDGYTISPAIGYNLAASAISPPLQTANLPLPEKAVSTLFESMRRFGYCVDFSKTINGITIRHTFSVYANPDHQQKLLLHFFHTGDEMLVQRGHSYWRKEQITEPLQELINQGRLERTAFTSKQRFLSLGSCGGVKLYTRLTDMFAGKVDILATVGTGLTGINDAYNKLFPELVARYGAALTWKEVADKTNFIFESVQGGDYLHPGSLTAALHKLLHQQHRKATETGRPSDKG